jgi:hypothetical protein
MSKEPCEGCGKVHDEEIRDIDGNDPEKIKAEIRDTCKLITDTNLEDLESLLKLRVVRAPSEDDPKRTVTTALFGGTPQAQAVAMVAAMEDFVNRHPIGAVVFLTAALKLAGAGNVTAVPISGASSPDSIRDAVDSAIDRIRNSVGTNPTKH